MALFCVLGLWRHDRDHGLRLPLDPNEGWNAYHAAAAISGAPALSRSQSFMIDNYPPLSFYLVGALGRVLGDYILAGRIVFAALLLLCHVRHFAAALRLGCRRLAALLRGASVRRRPACLHRLCRQWTILRSGARHRDGGLPAAAPRAARNGPYRGRGVAVRAGRLRQAQCESRWPWRPTVWLAVYDRKSALCLAVLGITLLLFGLILFRFVYGTGLLAQLISARIYSLDNLRSGFDGWLRWSLVPLVGLTVLASLRWPDRPVRLVTFYAASGTILGLCFLGGAGVDANVMFDADIALALGAALLIEQIGRGVIAPVAAVAYALPLSLPPGRMATGATRTAGCIRCGRKPAWRKRTLRFLAARQGPGCAKCCLFAIGRAAAAVDVFNVGQQSTPARAATGARRLD